MNAVAQENGYDDEIELVLAYHKGDVREAIEALLKDRDFLVKEIELPCGIALAKVALAIVVSFRHDKNRLKGG